MDPQPGPYLEAPSPPEPAGRALTTVLVLGLLVLLTLVLIFPWADSGTVFWPPELGEILKGKDVHRLWTPDGLAQMFSPWLLPALGLTLVLRRGSMDWSVWVCFAGGAVAAARVIQAGHHPLVVLGAVLAVGLATGALHAAAVTWLKLPGWGVTFITATVGLSAVSAGAGGRVLTVGREPLARWLAAGTPVVLTVALYVGAMLVVLAVSISRRLWHVPGRRTALAGALIASAALSSLGGLCWVLKAGRTPLPGYLIGDLRVAVSAIMVGAVAIRGTGRSPLLCLFLPVAMLTATIWRQSVWPTPAWAVDVNLLVLAAMALVTHWTFAQVLCSRTSTRKLFPALAALGMVSLAAASAAPVPARDVPRSLAGLIFWGTGAGGAAIDWVRARRKNVCEKLPGG